MELKIYHLAQNIVYFHLSWGS